MPRLTEQEQQEILRYIEADKPLPDKFRFSGGDYNSSATRHPAIDSARPELSKWVLSLSL